MLRAPGRKIEFRKGKHGSHALIGLTFSLIVAAAAVFAFSLRTIPAFPETEIKVEHLLVNGVAAAGNRMVAIGEMGHIFASEDAGKTWEAARVTPQRGASLTQVFFVNDRLGFAVGYDHWILRTEDGGRSWDEVHFDGERSEPLLGIWANAGGAVYTVGAFGTTYLSKNHGKTWWKRDTGLGDSHLYAVAGGNGSRMLIAGEQGAVARSEDAGVTWVKLPKFYKGSLFGLVGLSADEWIAYGMRGSVYVTRDFGNTWQEKKTGTVASLFGGTVTSKGHIVLVGQGGTILVSADRGGTFRQSLAAGGRSLSAVAESADGNLLLGGESGVNQIQPALTVPTAKESPGRNHSHGT